MAQSPATRPSLLVRLRDPADASAWTRFVEIYAPCIYGFGRKKKLQDADAADLTQDVLHAVARSIRRFDYDPAHGAFRGWLFTIVRNKLVTMLERRGKAVPGTGDTANLQKLEQHAAPAESADAVWDQEYERYMLAWAAEQVRPTVEPATWQAFWQTAVDGKPAKAVAAELGLSVAAVYMAKSRTLARLKESIRAVHGESTAPSEAASRVPLPTGINS